MSLSPLDQYRFLLNGEEPLNGSYDALSDVLYLWRTENRPAVARETSEKGILVRVSEETGELLGVTILDWSSRQDLPSPIRFAAGDQASAEVDMVIA